jgi:hypothetical protein
MTVLKGNIPGDMIAKVVANFSVCVTTVDSKERGFSKRLGRFLKEFSSCLLLETPWRIIIPNPNVNSHSL